MRAPVTYYGGKQNMAKHILNLIPGHITYVEPFFGGGSIYFLKEPSQVEVINDLDERLITLYRTMKNKFPALKAMLHDTLHSRQAYKEALAVMKNPQHYSDLRVAWATYIACNMSYASKIGAGWAFCIKTSFAGRYARKLDSLKEDIVERLRHTTIECMDALKVIKYWDSPNTLFYLDPPYPEGDCGHYTEGKDVYYDLLELLPSIKGKFILSSYPSQALSEFRAKNGYYGEEYVTTISAKGNSKANKDSGKKKKTECLTWNFNKNVTESHEADDTSQITLLELLGESNEQRDKNPICEGTAGASCQDTGD